MKSHRLRKPIAKLLAAAMAAAAFAPYTNAFAADAERVYSYNLEDEAMPQISDGGAEYEILSGYSGNDTRVLKIDKKSTGTANKDNRVQLYPLGESVSISDDVYFEVSFDLYTDGAGIDSVQICNGSAAALCTPMTIGSSDTDALRANEWNSVTALFKLSKQRQQSPFTVYGSVADITVNDRSVATASTLDNIRQMSSLNDLFDVRLVIKSNKGETFTAYTDNMSLVLKRAAVPMLTDGEGYTVDEGAGLVTVEEGTTVGALAAAEDCTVTVYRGGEVLGAGEVLDSDCTILVENAVGASREYRVAAVPRDTTLKIEDGTGYRVQDGNIVLASKLRGADLKVKNADNIRFYTDCLKNETLSEYDTLAVGNIIEIENDEASAVYTVSSDTDTVYTNFLGSGESLTFTNVTEAVKGEKVTGIGGKSEQDSSYKVYANARNGSADACCKATLINKADTAAASYRVDFNVLPNDEKFVSVSLAGGWTVRMTPRVGIGENMLARDKWNHVTYILHLGEVYQDSSRYKLDVTSDVYVNGSRVMSGEKVTTYTTDPTKDTDVFPILLCLNGTDSESEFITYIDDVIVTAPKAEPTLASDVTNTIAGLAMTDTDIILSSSYDFGADSGIADAISLNGERISAENISVGKSSVRISLGGLNNGEVYKLEVQAGGAEDIFARAFDDMSTSFETVAGVRVKRLAFNKRALSEGELTAYAEGLENMTDKPQTAALIMQLFKDGRLVSTAVSDTALAGDESVGRLENTMEIPDISDGAYVLKCFLWSGLESRISYASYISLDNN